MKALRICALEAALDEQIATYNTAIEAGDKEAASKAWDEVLRRQYRLIMERRAGSATAPLHRRVRRLRCDVCGQCVRASDPKIRHEMTQPDCAFGGEEWETLCAKCNKSLNSEFCDCSGPAEEKNWWVVERLVSERDKDEMRGRTYSSLPVGAWEGRVIARSLVAARNSERRVKRVFGVTRVVEVVERRTVLKP